MTADTAEMTAAELPCHGCGYDLRAHAGDGRCPECGASVAEARRWAPIPWRPRWSDSDRRWRRRVLAGVWILALVPLMGVLEAFGWAARLPVPTPYDFHGTVRTLDTTLLSGGGVYEPLAFCIGIVLLFAAERGRRPARLDWTRRWGVIASYVALLLSAVQILFIVALVSVGIAAVFLSMPPKYQPAVTQGFVELSAGYLRYGPYPSDTSAAALVAFSSVAVLLACVPLFDALRSSGSRWWATIVLAPLACFALWHLAQVGRYGLGLTPVTSTDVFRYGIYFWPAPVVFQLAGDRGGITLAGTTTGVLVAEVMKWCCVVAIAIWLTIAQLAALRRRKEGSRA